jgi:hypothetical protein
MYEPSDGELLKQTLMAMGNKKMNERMYQSTDKAAHSKSLGAGSIEIKREVRRGRERQSRGSNGSRFGSMSS